MSDDLDKAVREFERELEKLAVYIPRTAAQHAQALIATTNLFKGTALKNSFTVTTTGFSSVIQTKKTYASFLEEGTPAHTIRARGRALRFSVGGETIYRRSVNHPGTKATHFFSLATTLAGQQMEAEFEQLAAEIAKAF